MYLDLFIIQNLLYDYLILTGVALLTEETFISKRLIAGLVVSQCISLVLYVVDMPVLLSFVPVLVIWITFKYQNLKQLVKRILYFYCLSMIISGGIYTISHFVKFDVGIITYVIILFGLSVLITTCCILHHKFMERELTITQFMHDVTIMIGQQQISGVGFVDTGNHLVDSKTLQPIMMLPKQLVTNDNLLEYLDLRQIEYWYTEYSVINASTQKLLVLKPTIIIIDGKVSTRGMIGIVDEGFKEYDFLLQPKIVMGC
ncbi:MAG TPA: peptidase [Firmicutes bacterium]|nr:peptidase [Bacillota bacterium]